MTSLSGLNARTCTTEPVALRNLLVCVCACACVCVCVCVCVSVHVCVCGYRSLILARAGRNKTRVKRLYDS